VQHLVHLMPHGLKILEIEGDLRPDIDAPIAFAGGKLAPPGDAGARVVGRIKDVGWQDFCSRGHRRSPSAPLRW
jgi:hypothetical protein